MKSSHRLAQLLEEHCMALGTCRRCGYADPAIVPIVSEARTPRVMLVGQAPGKAEIANRRPFAGRAGKTLFRWLERAGVDEATVRAHVYIAAITRCYPGPSPSGRGDQVPSLREREQCSSWLDAELRLIKPELLIPVGRLAIDQFFDGNRPLDVLVGRSHVVRHVGGESLVVPLPHPSGASSWMNVPAHRALLERALHILERKFAALGVMSNIAAARRSA